MPKPSTVWVTINCEKFWKRWEYHLTCLLRNLYADQEATVKIGHRTTDWFQIGKGVHQGCILSPCLFNFYVEYIMKNTGLEEAQAGIKVVGRNINSLRYADDTTLMAESEEELKSLLMKVKEESKKVGLWTVAHQVLCPWDSPGKNTGVGCHACPRDQTPICYVSCVDRQVL